MSLRVKLAMFTLLGAVLPPSAVFFLNAGLIFDIPNYLEILEPLTAFLSSTRENDSIAELLVGTATIFVVFFVFVQLAYSLRHVPHWFVRKYLIRHEHTYAFSSFFVSRLFVTGFFAVRTDLHAINHLYLTLSIPFSVCVTIAYFFEFAAKSDK